MPRSRTSTWVQVALVLVLVTAFIVAEWLRHRDPIRGTVLSMAGWTSFAILFLCWLWEDCGVRAGLRRLAGVAGLTAIAFAVLSLYYVRSHLLASGIEVDATYTFMGLEWFLTLDNPITFAGRTTSFAQFPMALLGHLPAALVGFDRLGPYAIHVGITLQVAMLLAVVTTFFVDGRPLVYALTVALAAAVFSNRLTVLLCNLTGYAIPAISIGFMFLVTELGDRRPSVLMPRIGGFLLLSLMHHYPGWFFVLPLTVLWVIAARNPWQRFKSFVRANLPLCTAMLVAVTCVSIHPELLINRIRAVTSPSLDLVEFRTKIIQNWSYLSTAFPPTFVRMFFVESTGSWHLLDIPPLGGFLPYIACANWVLTVLTLGRRGVVFVLRFAVLAVCLLVLTALQHMVTGFENYRDMTLVLGLFTPGLGFVFRIPHVRPFFRALLIVYAIAVAAYAYVDVAEIAGKHYAVREYAPEAQATMERMRRFWRHDTRPRDATINVVVPDHFPLEWLYMMAARDHGIELRFLAAAEFCKAPIATVSHAMLADCGRLAFAIPVAACDARWQARLGWQAAQGAGGLGLYVFESACGKPPPRDQSAPGIIEIP